MVGDHRCMDAGGVEIVIRAREQFSFSVLEDYRDGRKSLSEARILIEKNDRPGIESRLVWPHKEAGIFAVHARSRRTCWSKHYLWVYARYQ